MATVTLNRGHPLALGLKWCVAGGSTVDLVSGKVGTFTGAKPTTVSGNLLYGKAHESTVTNSTQRVSWPDTLVAASVTTRHTIMVVSHWDTQTSSSQAVSVPYSGALSVPYQSMGFTAGGTGTGGLVRYTVGGGHNFVDFALGFWVMGERHQYTWTRDGATNTVYKDGVQYATDGTKSAGTVDWSGAGTEIVLHGFSTSVPFESFDGRTYLAAIWNRALSRAEITELYRDPRVLLEVWPAEPDLAIFNGAAGGGPTDVNVTTVAAVAAISTPTVTVPGADQDVNVTTVAAVAAVGAPSFTTSTPTITWVADRGQRNNNATGNAVVDLAAGASITVGNYLIARVSVDNTGGSGARPGLTVTDTAGNTWTEGAGALQDPGTASSGIACYLCYAEVDNAYADGDDVTFTWTTGTPRSAIVIEEWSGIDGTTPVAVAEAAANNVSSTAQPTSARTPSAADQLMYVSAAIEGQSSAWGAQDSDTTNGTWSDVTKDQADTGTAATSASVYGGYKVVTASGAQTWNNTLGVTSDWATIGIVFAPAVPTEAPVAVTVAAVASIPTPTVDVPADIFVDVTAVAAVTAIATPAVTAPTNVTVTAVTAVAAIATPAITTGVSITTTAVAAVTAIATPTRTATANITAAAVAAVAAIATPIVTAGTSISVTAVAAVTVIATPTRTASANITTTAVAAVTAIAAPTVSTSVSVTVTAVAAVTAIATPTVTTGTSAAVTAVVAVSAIPTPTVTTAANIAVTAVAAVSAISTPSITTGADANIAPNVVTAVVAIPTPFVSTPTSVAVTMVAAVTAIPTPAISTGVSISVTRVAAVTAVATPTFTRTTTPTPTAVAAIAAVPSPVWSATATVAVSTVTAVVIIGASAPFVSAFGGNATQTLTSPGATQTITLHQSATQTFTSQGASQEITPV